MDWYGNWSQLTGDEQSFLVAVYITAKQEEAVVAHYIKKGTNSG